MNATTNLIERWKTGGTLSVDMQIGLENPVDVGVDIRKLADALKVGVDELGTLRDNRAIIGPGEALREIETIVEERHIKKPQILS
jgi:hypothetical protein